MVRREYSLSLKQKMNMEQKAIMELLDKLLFLRYTDEEKLKGLDYIKCCRLRYLEFEKQLLLEKQGKDKKIQNYLHVAKNKKSNY